MRVLNQRLAELGGFVLVFALPALACAVEPAEFSKQLAALVKSAHEQLAEVRNQLDQVEPYLDSAANSRGAAGGNRGDVLATAGRGQFTELERAARTLADVGNQVVSLTGKCGKESHDIAAKFRSYTQRVHSDIGQIESGSSVMGQMAAGKIRRDIDETEQQLQTVAGLSGNCS